MLIIDSLYSSLKAVLLNNWDEFGSLSLLAPRLVSLKETYKDLVLILIICLQYNDISVLLLYTTMKIILTFVSEISFGIYMLLLLFL